MTDAACRDNLLYRRSWAVLLTFGALLVPVRPLSHILLVMTLRWPVPGVPSLRGDDGALSEGVCRLPGRLLRRAAGPAVRQRLCPGQTRHPRSQQRLGYRGENYVTLTMYNFIH